MSTCNDSQLIYLVQNVSGCNLIYNRKNKLIRFEDIDKSYYTNISSSTADCDHDSTIIVCKCSNTGTKGEKGDKGDKGDKGEKGDKGDKGERGERGESCYGMGLPGPPGPPGPPGTSGKDGLNGKDGLPGKDGCNGKPGLNGQPGKDGLNGKDGQPGKDGKNGIDGLPGKDGKDGLPGKDGKDGLPGKNGADGLPGKDGQPGKDGLNGRDGRDGSPGSQGPPGKDGHPGPPGPPGKDGKDGLPGKNGTDGKDGLPGPSGPPGKDGCNGRDGIPGLTGQPGPPGPVGKFTVHYRYNSIGEMFENMNSKIDDDLCVISSNDKDNGKIYKYKSNRWEYLFTFSTLEIKYEIPVQESKITVFNSMISNERPLYYNCLYIKDSSKMFKIVQTSSSKYNTTIYNFNNQKLEILRSGIYKISYNVCWKIVSDCHEQYDIFKKGILTFCHVNNVLVESSMIHKTGNTFMSNSSHSFILNCENNSSLELFAYKLYDNVANLYIDRTSTYITIEMV